MNIDALCDEQLLLALLIRNARRRGDFTMVAQYVRCWQAQDNAIKKVAR